MPTSATPESPATKQQASPKTIHKMDDKPQAHFQKAPRRAAARNLFRHEMVGPP